MNDEITIPHGGVLVDRVLRGHERAEAQARARRAPKVPLTAIAESDLELIAVGALSPLTGFMGKADYERVVHEMRLSGGLPWSLPITLPVDVALAHSLTPGQEVALVTGDGS